MPEINRRPVIIGYDAVSPMGVDLEGQWEALASGASGLGDLTRIDSSGDFPVKMAGQAPDLPRDEYDFLGPRHSAQWTSPIFRYGMYVVQRALDGAGLIIDDSLGQRVATTLSTAIGGLDAVIAADRDMISRGRLPAPMVNPNSCVNMIAGKASMLTGATGPIATTVSACATGSTSMITGAMFLASGMADVAICGAVDFPLIPPIVAGFATMNGAYKFRRTGENLPPEEASRPFSRGRRGFVIAEGAGCVLLATREFARAHGLSHDIELAGWATTSDAHHFVMPRLETVQRCMEQAVEHAGISPGDVACVNAHAASTRVGDEIEARALANVFGDDPPPVTANKSQFGHAMGASSALESIWAMHGMQKDTLLPTLNYDPDPDIAPVRVCTETTGMVQEYVLKNAFGFGGCNACLVFRRTG